MTRSAFYDARLAHWKAEGDPRVGDPEFQALRDVEAAQAAGVIWDPSVTLPDRLAIHVNNPVPPGTAEAYINGVYGTRRLAVAEIHRIDPRETRERARRLAAVEAMVAAYNRERAGQQNRSPEFMVFAKETADRPCVRTRNAARGGRRRRR